MLLIHFHKNTKLYIALFGLFWSIFLLIDASCTASLSSNYLMVVYNKMKRSNPIGYGLNYFMVIIYIGLYSIALLKQPLINYKQFMIYNIGIFLLFQLIMTIQYYWVVIPYTFSPVQISAQRVGYGEIFVK